MDGLSVQKEIKCSRCGCLKTVPIDWEFRECVKCHERTVRKRLKGKMPIDKIEKKAVDNLVNFESAWKRYKRRFVHGKLKGMTKEQFREQYFRSQSTKIEQIKAVIAKYNDKDAHILSHDCLRFRILLAERNQYLHSRDFHMSQKDANLFYNHCQDCGSCSRYYALHRNTVPELADLGDKEVSQSEFDSALTEFYNTLRGKKSIDDILDSMQDVPYDDGET